jgi:hypothetical protein
MTTQLWNPKSRLTPWVPLDSAHIAWVAELHANEPTDADRRILCNVARRLQRRRSVRLSGGPPHLPLCAVTPN